jgi:hypothetical protein
VYEQKPVDYLFDMSVTNVSKLFNWLQLLSQHLFSKRKKESSLLEVMMNENGGSNPTGSEEWTLHLLYFYLDVILALN